MALSLVYVILLLYLVTAICRAQVFVVEPGPGPVVSPIGSVIELTCSVNREYLLRWFVQVPGIVELNNNDGFDAMALLSRGIYVKEGSNSTSSILIINATQVNSVEYVQCEAVFIADTNTRNRSPRVDVTIFGIPSPPTNFALSVNGLNSLRVEWSSSIIEGVNLQFILTVTNLNSSSSQPLVISSITTQYYNFTMKGDPSSCDVYTFQVTALNDAGASDPSEIITRSLPSLQDISLVEDSLQHSLVYTENSLTLNVTFNVIAGCMEYPVTSYTLVLVDSEGGKRNLSSSVTTGRSLSLVVTGLVENSMYSYYIMATNRIGDSSSTSIDITTTDVEGVSLCLVKGTTYSIMCSYISGNNARGCVFILVGEVEGVVNITGIIDRTSSEGVLIEVPNNGSYREVVAFDLESDNTTGTLPVRGNIKSHPSICLVSMSPNDVPQPHLSPTTIAIIVVSPILIMFVVPIAFIIGYTFGKKRGQGEMSTDMQHDTELVATEELNIGSGSGILPGGRVPNKDSNMNFEQNPSYDIVTKSPSEVSNHGVVYEEIAPF